MATLFNGHKYTFKKDGSDLVLLDSTDHSHETITFRKGMIISGSSTQNPIMIKPANNTYPGIQGYETGTGGDLTFKLYSSNDDGVLKLYRNGAEEVKLSAGDNDTQNLMVHATRTGTTTCVEIQNGNNDNLFKVYHNGEVRFQGNDGQQDFLIGKDTTNNARIGINYNDPSAPIHLRSVLTSYGYMHKLDNRNTDSTVKCLTIKRNGTDRFFVYTNGSINSYYTSITSLSDERLKEQITDATSQWNDIKNIEWKKFKYLPDPNGDSNEEHVQLGVIAQQVETISPGLVKESPPTSEQIKQNSVFGTLYTADDQDVIDGNKKVDDVKEVHHNVKDMNYSILWMKSCKALQEAMIRIEQLEAKVTALENN